MPVLNPHLELRSYQWPVYKITKANWSPKKHQKGQYPIVVYRHPETLGVRFMASNPLVAALLEQIRPRRHSIETIVTNLAKRQEISPEKRDPFYQEGIQSIGELRQKGIIIGMTQRKRSGT